MLRQQQGIACLRDPRWWRHYGEMVLAMLAGMVVLGIVVDVAGLQPDGDAARLGVMFATMTVGMDVWMLYRRVRRRGIVEMTLATNLPLAVFVPLLRADAISTTAADGGAHLAMLVAMAAVMIVRSTDHLHGTPT